MRYAITITDFLKIIFMFRSHPIVKPNENWQAKTEKDTCQRASSKDYTLLYC